MKIRKPTETEEAWLDEIEDRSHSSYGLVVDHAGRTFGCKIVSTLGSGDRLTALRDAMIALTDNELEEGAEDVFAGDPD